MLFKGLARAVRLISWLAPSIMSINGGMKEGSKTGLTETKIVNFNPLGSRYEDYLIK